MLVDDYSGGGQRQVGQGQTATLRVGQHLYLTLSGHKTKRYTLNNTVAPIMSRTQHAVPAAAEAATQRGGGLHKRSHGDAVQAVGSERDAASGGDPFGWSLADYPADKRARIRMADNGGGSGGGIGGSGKATPDGKQSDGLLTPPAPVDMRQYKQTALSFSPLSADTLSASPHSALPSFSPSSPGFYHLAFPCLALNITHTQFGAIIRLCVSAVASFLVTHTAPMLRLLLCENDDGAYLAIKRYVDTADDDSVVQLRADTRFTVAHASVAALGQSSDVSQSVVNSTDWKWSSAGDKKRRAIDTACNHQLTQLTLASLPFGKTAGREGQVQCVPLTQHCPLMAAGVRQVIQVITPELKAAASRTEESVAGGALNELHEKHDESDKLSDEYASKLLKVYQKLFDTWYVLLKLPKHYTRPAQQRSPRSALFSRPDPSQLRPSQSDALLPDNFSTSSTPLPRYSPTRSTPLPAMDGGWNNALRVYLQHPRPASVQSSVYCEDRSYLCIYDGYPKSRCHLLLHAKSHLPQLSSIAAVTAETLYVLHDMQQRADHIVAALMQQLQANSSRRLEFWVGFHALPSLQPLHCHIITSDLSTVHMKYKKVRQQLTQRTPHTTPATTSTPSHLTRPYAASALLRLGQHYNSFATPFFVKIEDVIQRVEKDGKYVVDENRVKLYEKAALKCWRCQAMIQTMPALKQHLLTCNT